ncbi:hypothetical protein AB0M05_40315 [Streptomyces violaceusniger]|uniref:hypothetical protein n=1 Tax=Streptomyces violaceusniger TaxID=68280 RepID=UPI0034392406
MNMPVRSLGIELDELGKFFALYAERQSCGDDRVMPMFSDRIDAAWHHLATDSAALASFCHRHASIPVGHRSIKGSGRVDWIDEYTARFGALPTVWFADASGRIDTDILSRYERTGTVVTNWDCSPVPSGGDGDDEVATPTETAAARRP